MIRHATKILLLVPFASTLAITTCSTRAGEPRAAGAGAAISVAALDRRTPVDFEAEILPMLRDNCLACHNRTRSKADLNLETPADIRKGCEDGPVVVAGDAEKSLLFQVCTHQATPVMPPKENKVSAVNLNGTQLALLRLWINQGAKGEVRATKPLDWQAPSAALQAVYAVALTADGRYAATSRGNHVDVYDLPLRRLIASLRDESLARLGLYGPAGAAHRDLVQSLAFSPDGTRLATGAFAEVKLWRCSAPAQKWVIATTALNAAVVSADGHRLAVAGEGSPIEVVDTATGKPVNAISASTSAARGIAFSPDAGMLAVVSADRGMRISSASGVLLAATVLPVDATAVCWIDGKRVAVGCVDGIIRIWQVPEAAGAWGAPQELKSSNAAVNCLAVVPGGTQLISGCADGGIHQWYLADGKLIRQVSQGSPVTSLVVRADGKCFASVGQGNAGHLWDAQKGTAVAELKCNLSVLRAQADQERANQLAAGNVAFFKNVVQTAETSEKAASNRLAAATAAKTAAEKVTTEKQTARDKLAADTKTAPDATAKADAEIATAQQSQGAAQTELRLATSAAGRIVGELASAKSSLDRAAEVLRAAEASLTAARLAVAAADKPARAVAFSADNLTIAVATENGQVTLFTADTGYPFQVIETGHAAVQTLAFRGGDLLLSGGKDAALWSLGSAWALERTIGSGDTDSPLVDRVNALAFSPDGRTLATGSGEPSRSGQVKLWDVATGSPVRECINAHSDTVLTLEFSPDGKWLASGAADRFARVLDVATGKTLKSMEGHTDHVLSVSWRADGRSLATGGADNLVKFWDVATSERKANVAGFNKAVNAIHYLGVSDQVMAVCADGQIRIVNDTGGSVRAIAGVQPDFFHTAAITPDGRWMAVGGQSGQLTAWPEPSAGNVLAFPPPVERR